MPTTSQRPPKGPRARSTQATRELRRRQKASHTACVVVGNSHVKDVIEAYRADLGMTQDELVRTAEISLSTLQRIFRGHKPLLKQARALEDALDWERGSLGDVLAEGHPTPKAQQERSMDERIDELQSTAEEWIKHGNELLDQIAAMKNERRRAG